MADPPFSHVDLISCRNLLIYLDPSAQKQVLTTFHYALNLPGFLVLGTAESVSGNTDYFELMERNYKIYKKNPVVSHPPMFIARQDDKLFSDTRRVSSQNPPPPLSTRIAPTVYFWLTMHLLVC